MGKRAKNIGAKGSKKRWKHRGIGADAKALNVSRWFLYLVLEGRATSAPLLARYQVLKAEQKGKAA